MHVSVEELKNRLNHYANVDQNYRPRLIRYVSQLLQHANIGANLPQAFLEVEPQTKIRLHEILKEIPRLSLERLIGYTPNNTKFHRLRNALEGIRASYVASPDASQAVRQTTADKQLLVQNYYEQKSNQTYTRLANRSNTASKQLLSQGLKHNESTQSKPTASRKRAPSPSREVAPASKRRKTPAETQAFLRECAKNPAFWEQQSGNDKSNFRKQ
ncbi:MAG: hypothetical protein MK137_01920 [Rickettsiales bacterium]|nr:hypothetical protein [Rickettsiales bacterium]